VHELCIVVSSPLCLGVMCKMHLKHISALALPEMSCPDMLVVVLGPARFLSGQRSAASDFVLRSALPAVCVLETLC